MYQLRANAAKVFDRGGYRDEIGEANIFDSKEDAISGIFNRLDKDICATCEQRIFVECKSIEKPVQDPEE
jgi:SulP family sulfate permease